MDRRSGAGFLLLLAAAACGETENVPQTPSEPVVAAETAEMPAKKSSIMRPDVVAETQPEPAVPAPPPQAERAVVQFVDGNQLTPEARQALDALLTPQVLEGPSVLVIRGHSDSPGSDEANLRASRERAEAVRAYLAERGMAGERMRIVALGETRPVAPNATPEGQDFPEGRARNRRVEVEVVAPPAGPAQAPPA